MEVGKAWLGSSGSINRATYPIMHFISVQTPVKFQWKIYMYSDILLWGAQYLQDVGSMMVELLHAEMTMLWLRPPLATYLENMGQLEHLPVQSEKF